MFICKVRRALILMTLVFITAEVKIGDAPHI